MTLNETLKLAFDYFEEHGFNDEAEVAEWVRKIEKALRESMTPQAEFERMIKQNMNRMFDRSVSHANRFTAQRLGPELRALLDKRIMASVNLIKLNRDEMIGRTLKRFVGWISSVPETERHYFNRRELRAEISKPLRQLPFTERRVMIDQGHKLAANVEAVLAEANGAIAARWQSHYQQHGYDYREDHKERDVGGHVYMIRNSWADKNGLIVKGDDPWSDQITQPGEEVFCRCKFIYLFHLKQLPKNRLTQKGLDALKGTNHG